MSSFVATLAALVIIFGAGFGVSLLFMRHMARIAFAELIALSWLFGAATISLSLWLLGLLLRGVSLQIAVTIISLSLTLIGIAQWRKSRPPMRLPWPRNWIERALAFLLCFEVALVFFLAFKHTLGWDGLVIWELKARYAYLNGGALPPEYFSDATRAFSHPEYPLFLPMLEMWIYFWIGDCDQYWVKLISPVFYAVGVLLLAQAGTALSGKRSIGLIAANLLLFVPFLTRFAGGVVQGYADVPLSVFYLAAFCFLFVFSRQNSGATLSIFAALAGILPWIKQEGFILWLVLAFCAVIIIWRRRGIRAALIAILPGVCVFASWNIYLRAMHARPAQDFLPVSFSVLSSSLHRLGPIVRSLLNETTAISHWNLLWFATLIAFVCIILRNRGRHAWMIVLCIVLPIALYCGTYLFSAWSDYQHHVRSSLLRLLWHVAPLSILAIAMALAPRRSEARLEAGH